VKDRVLEHFVISRGTGRAFIVSNGQKLRVIEDDGGQVASLLVLNARDHKEQGMARFSGNLSQMLGTGNHYRLGTIFSKVPYERPMLTVTRDTVGHHFLGPHCTGRMMEMWGAPDHRSCSNSFAEALAEFGLTLEDIYSPASINLFANISIESTGDGRIHLLSPTARAGDLVEFRAEMDVLVVVSACPDDVSPLNGHSCKPIAIQIVDD
jgi:uncharacterized protein